MRGAPTTSAILIFAAAISLGTACGRKTDVRPPHFVVPSVVEGLAAENELRGVKLRWKRPTRYADGSQMLDLDGFRIERRRPCCAFIKLADVPVEDRTRFQRANSFDYVDERVEVGELYSYRVVAITVDRYESDPCEPVQIQRRLPLESN